MTQEEIIRMARDCGINFHQAGWPELERFFYSAQEAEREACAKASEAQIERWMDDRARYAASECAAAIRARGQQ